ncbi:MAG: peptidoglycan-binding protein [Actinobacteria bacterium]|nr:peptidoglycan-binding protein [Actinomycetota bacterium]
MRSPRTLTALLLGFALAAASCGGGAEETTTTTSTTVATTTTTTLPPEAAFVVASEGDDNPAVRALQFLLVCNGYEQTVVDGRDETLVPDGQYGAITSTVVDRVQRDLGLTRDGSFVNAELYERLAATCDNTRSVYLSESRMSVTAGGYASATLPDSWTFWAQEGQRVTLTPAAPPLRMGLYDPDGAELMPVADTEGYTIDLTSSGTYTVKVNSDEPLTYDVTVGLPPHYSVLLLQSTGLDLVDFGDSPTYVLDVVGAILGDPSDDTGWVDEGNGCVKYRRVVWGNDELWLDFTDAGEDALEEPTFRPAGTEHFAAWTMRLPPSGDPTLPPLATPSGLVVGASAAEVEDVYGDRVEIDETFVSIVDGILTGELNDPDGTLLWLRSGNTVCVPVEDDDGSNPA